MFNVNHILTLVCLYFLLCRADGQSSSENLHLHKHQGTSWLLLCCVWTRWRSGVQCTSHPCTSGCHARNSPVPSKRCVTVSSSESSQAAEATQPIQSKNGVLFLLFSVQIKSLGNELKEGDVILSNHPCAGGSHLPDLTVITPVNFHFSTWLIFGVFFTHLCFPLLCFYHCLLSPSFHHRCLEKEWAGQYFL